MRLRCKNELAVVTMLYHNERPPALILVTAAPSRQRVSKHSNRYEGSGGVDDRQPVAHLSERGVGDRPRQDDVIPTILAEPVFYRTEHFWSQQTPQVKTFDPLHDHHADSIAVKKVLHDQQVFVLNFCILIFYEDCR